MSQATIEELSGRLLDDDLSEIEIDGLLELIEADDSSRLVLRDQLRIAEWLTQAYDEVRAAERFTAALESRIRQAETPPVSIVTDAEDCLASLPAERLWRRGWQSLRDVACNYGVLSAVVSGLFITTILLSLALWTVPDWRPAPFTAAEPVAVAKLSGMHQAVWADKQFKLRPGEHLLTGDRLELNAGVAEIEFKNGATITLHGPAHLLIQDRSAVTLEQGELVARVGAAARGFRVDTSAANFVDLGTEFAVAVGEKDQVEVHVLEGLIEARLAGGRGEATVHELRAGEALRVEGVGGSVTRLPARTRGFVRKLPRWENIPIENASFESPQLGGGESWRAGATGWVASHPASHGVSRFGQEFVQAVPEGEQMCFLNEGAMSQSLDERLQALAAYHLTVWVGNRLGAYSPNYTVELCAGDRLLASTTNAPQPAKGQFGLVVVQFEAPADHESVGEPLKIVLKSNGGLATRTQNHFDHVRLGVRYAATTLPERPAEP
ncbi:MAG: FecR family protein [Pirellulales bacterium]